MNANEDRLSQIVEFCKLIDKEKFAHTLDNFQPLMLQSATHGKAWKEGGRKLSEVLGRNEKSAEGSQTLWEFAKEHFIRPEIDAGNLTDDCTGKA